MRTLSAQSQKALDSGSYRVKTRVSVKNAAGVFKQLDVYCRFDPFDSAEWGDDVDASCVSATIRLKQESHLFSLAPLLETSPINLDFDPAGAASPLIAVGREIKLETAVCPLGIEPASGDWTLDFHGYIDRWTGDGSALTLDCRDLTAKLIDAYIEKERVYAFGNLGIAGSGFRIWEPNTEYQDDEPAIPTTANLSEHFYLAAAGTSGTNEPVWPTSGTVADNTVTWTREDATSDAGKPVEYVMQEILNDTVSSPPTLNVPVSPSWNIGPYEQDRVPAFDAVRALAEQIGWDARYRWDAGSSTFKFTLFEPDRAKVAVDRTFSKQAYLSVDRLAVDIAGIRNAIRVIYSDSADLDLAGYPKRKVIEVTSATSITAYGRRFMEISEDSNSNIDTSTEATDLANAVLSDLATPNAELEVTDFYMPFVELGDLYRFSANGRHFSSNQDLAVVGYRHSLSGGTHKTSLTCRGKPSGGYKKWHSKAAHPAAKQAHRFASFDATTKPTLTVEGTIGGLKLQWPIAKQKLSKFDEVEWHVSTSSSFTPDGTTLVGITKAEHYEVQGLVPGKTYYVRAVPRGRNDSRPVFGQATAAVAAEVSRANAAHLVTDVDWGSIPLNGAFETQTDPDAPPDHWAMYAGTWDSHVTKKDDNSGVSGSGYLRFENVASATAGIVTQSKFPVIAGLRYRVRYFRKNVSGAGTGSITIPQYKADLTATSAPNDSWNATDQVGSWVEDSFEFTAASDAAWAELRFEKSANTIVFDLDQVKIERRMEEPASYQDQSVSPNLTRSDSTPTQIGSTVSYLQLTPGRRVTLMVLGSLYSTVAGTEGRIRLSLQDSGGTQNFDYPVTLNTANEHQQFAFAHVFTPISSLIESMSARAYWYRQSGTGTLTMDASDSLSILAL